VSRSFISIDYTIAKGISFISIDYTIAKGIRTKRLNGSHKTLHKNKSNKHIIIMVTSMFILVVIFSRSAYVLNSTTPYQSNRLFI
jgi:hypothetical protein